MDRHLLSLEALATKLQVKYGPDDALFKEVASDLRGLESAGTGERASGLVPLTTPIAQRLSWRLLDEATRGGPL